MTDADDDDALPELVRGHAEPGEPDEPFRGWLYLPDLSSTTRWTAYEIRRAVEPPTRRHVGFRRD